MTKSTNPLRNPESKTSSQFDSLADAWRDPNGPFKHVLAFNQCRFKAIERALAKHQLPSRPILLDLGCGAGVLTEKFAKINIECLGIDTSSKSIEIAKTHAKQQELNNLKYVYSAIEDFNCDRQFDIILNTEVIEHVDDPEKLIAKTSTLLKPGGVLVMATLNRTPKSFLFGIIGAEYILGLLPRGTHQWSKFVKPKEMINWAKNEGLVHCETIGMSYNPFNGSWKASTDTGINYVSLFIKDN